MTYRSKQPLAPSARVAHIIAIVSAFLFISPWTVWTLLFTGPLSVYYQRKARRERIESEGRYRSAHWLLDRPILLIFMAWPMAFLIQFLLVPILYYAFGIPPV